jgi:hypothetical protein
MIRAHRDAELFVARYEELRADPRFPFHAFWLGCAIYTNQPSCAPEFIRDLQEALIAAVQARAQLGAFDQKLAFIVKGLSARADLEVGFTRDFHLCWMEAYQEVVRNVDLRVSASLLLKFWTESFRLCEFFGPRTRQVLMEAIRVVRDSKRIIRARTAPLSALADCLPLIPMLRDPEQWEVTNECLRLALEADFRVLAVALRDILPRVERPHTELFEAILMLFGGDYGCRLLLEVAGWCLRARIPPALPGAVICVFYEVAFDVVPEACLVYLDDFWAVLQPILETAEQGRQPVLVYAICHFVRSFAELDSAFSEFMDPFVQFLFELAKLDGSELAEEACQTLGTVGSQLSVDYLRHVWENADAFQQIHQASFIMLITYLLENENRDDVVQGMLHLIETDAFADAEAFLQGTQLLGHIAAKNEQLAAPILETAEVKFSRLLSVDSEARIEVSSAFLTFLLALKRGFGEVYRDFIAQFLGPCLQIVLPQKDMICQKSVIDMIEALLDFLPEQEAECIIGILEGYLADGLEQETGPGCMLFQFRLWNKLSPELQAGFIERVPRVIDVFAPSASREVLELMLLQIFVPLMKRAPDSVASGYRIGVKLYQVIDTNHVISDVTYSFLGFLCRFTGPQQAELIAAITHDLGDPERQKSALEAAFPLTKYQLIPDDQMLHILVALLQTLGSDRDRLGILQCLCALLERDDQDTLHFIAQEMETFAQWRQSSDRNIRATVCEMLLYLVVHQPDLRPDLTKELIRAFPLDGEYKQSRSAAKSLIRIAQSDGAEAYAEDLFVALLNFFASDMIKRNAFFNVLPDDVIILEDLFLRLENGLQVETVCPEFAEAVAREATKRTRVEMALENARQRAEAAASNQ